MHESCLAFADFNFGFICMHRTGFAVFEEIVYYATGFVLLKNITE